MIAQGYISVQTGTTAPSDPAGWERTDVELNIVDPLVVHAEDEDDDIELAFTPSNPGLHTVTVYAQNRDPSQRDLVRMTKQPDRIEHYLLIFTPGAMQV